MDLAKTFRISLPAVRIECKGDFNVQYNRGCALKQYIDSDESVYDAWQQDKALLPDTTDLETAYQDVIKMCAICEECKRQRG